MSAPSTRLRRTLIITGRVLLAVILLWAIGLLALRLMPLDRITRVNSLLASWYWPLFAWRMSLYVAFIANYATVTRWFARRGHWPPARLERALHGRRFMAINVALLEAVISAPHWLAVMGR
ncbi:MAG TPA: hypothetical protein ENK05_09675 [Gammaproteobacteria bacterium]|nr:hypothetical protein [Gammaproteobacteria bacterium]